MSAALAGVDVVRTQATHAGGGDIGVEARAKGDLEGLGLGRNGHQGGVCVDHSGSSRRPRALILPQLCPRGWKTSAPTPQRLATLIADSRSVKAGPTVLSL